MTHQTRHPPPRATFGRCCTAVLQYYTINSAIKRRPMRLWKNQVEILPKQPFRCVCYRYHTPYHYHTPLSLSHTPIAITPPYHYHTPLSLSHPPITTTHPYHYHTPLSLSHRPITITHPYHYHTITITTLCVWRYSIRKFVSGGVLSY